MSSASPTGLRPFALCVRKFTAVVRLAGLLLVALVSACARPVPPATLATVVLGVEGEAQNLDPRYSVDAYSDRINKLIYRGLFKVAENGDVVPDLASSYQYAGDTSGAMVMSVELVPDAVFHDGKPVGPADVVWTYQSILKAGDSPRLAGLQALSQVTAVTVAGVTRVEFHLTQPFAPLLASLTMGIVPAGMGRELAQSPVGSGPFRLVPDTPSGTHRLLRYPSPLEGRVNELIVRAVKNDTTRAMALENGEIHLAINAIAPQDLARFETDPNVVVESFAGSAVSYLGFNLRDPILRDARVREAISHAIDRPALLDAMLGGTGHPMASILPRTNWAYNEALTADTYDPARARQLLDAAGYKPNEDGVRLSLEYKTSTNRQRVRIAEALAQLLGEVGIVVKIQSLEFGTFFQHVQRGNFQIFSLTWTGLTEPDILYNAFASDSTPPVGANRGYYVNAQVDDLLRRARRETVPAARRELYWQAQAIIATERPYAVLWDHDMVVVRRKHIPAFTPLPDGNYSFVDQLGKL